MDKKMKKICSLINEHNENIGLKEGEEGFVNESDTIKCLRIIGASKESSARKLRYEEIIECLPAIKLNGKNIKPIQLSKDIARVFRSDAKNKSENSITKLINSYDPSDHGSKQHNKLEKISKGKPFLVYNGKDLLIEESNLLLQEIISGIGPRKAFIKDGKFLNILCVGELPNQLVDENPCFPGLPLGLDGTCTKTGFNWSSTKSDIRGLIRIIVDRSRFTPSNMDNIKNLIDVLNNKNYINKFQLLYPEAYKEYCELKEIQNLPLLKVKLNNNNNQNKDRIKI